MSREKTLVKNTAILTIGKICTQLITFFLLPLYTGILSTEEYGTVDLLNTLVSLLLPVVTFQIEKGLFRELVTSRDDDENKKIIISTSIFTIIIQCIIYIIIFAIISPFVHNNYKIFLATNVLAYIFSSLLQQVSRGLGDNRKFSIASFFSALTTIIANIIFLVPIKLGANGMLLGTMVGQIICALYLYISLNLNKYINIKYFRKDVLKKLWKYSIPLIPNAISWWIFSASDRVIVSTILGISQNGILSAAHKFSSVYITLYNIFDMSWIEMITLHINDEDIEEFFNKMFNIVLSIFLAMGIGIIAVMPFVYNIMIDGKFVAGYNQIPIMMFGSIFNIVIGLISVIYAAKKNTKAIANTSGISAIINIVVHILLIQIIGLYAATISTFVAFFTMTIYRLYDIKKRYFTVRINLSLIIKTLIVSAMVIPSYYSNNTYFQVSSLIITIIYAILINKNTIEPMITIIKNKFIHENK